MGGKKKLGIKQMEKQQTTQNEAKAEKKKEKAAGGPKERKTTINIIAPDAKDQKIVAEIKKMNVLTPYAVSTKYGIRISTAKDFLEQLEANGTVHLVSGSHNLKIYKPAA
jgi:ribosomal protein S25